MKHIKISMLNGLINDFLIEMKMKGSSKHTLKGYKVYFKKFIEFVEQNNINFRELTALQVKLFRNQLVEYNLSPKTVNNYISALKNFYDYLVEEEQIKSNPIITRRLRVKEGQKLPRFLTKNELEKVNKWFTTIPEHVALGFRTMLATGMRVSEMVSVTPKDIIALDNGGYMIHVCCGKGKKERYVPIMDAEVVKDLLRFIENRSEDEPVFKIGAGAFISWARKCSKSTGVNFHTHRCRHTVGTRLLQKGVSLDKVQMILGHENISTTRRYARTAPEAVLELAAEPDKKKDDAVKEPKIIYRHWL